MVRPRFFMTVAASASVLMLQSLGFSDLQSLYLQPETSAPLNNIGFVAPVLAAESMTYKPPIRPRPAGRTSGTGSRGCDSKALPVPLTPLVPSSHVGQTISGHPTFFWYTADTKPVKFALVEPGVPKPILEQTVQATKPGIVQLELLEKTPELSTGKEYRWSVSVVCNPNRPSNDTFAQAFIERVAFSPDLSKQLESAKSNQDRARILAQAGMWYDALAALSKVSADEPSAHVDLLSLLDQVGLKEITTRERQNDQAARPQ